MDRSNDEKQGAHPAVLRGQRSSFAVLLVGTAVLHFANALVASHDPYVQFRVGDEAFYDTWAREIAGGTLARGHPFFTTPLFAYWLAALYRVGLDSVSAVLVANAVLGVAAVAFTYAAARRLAGPIAGFLAGALVALSRAVLVYEGAPEKTTLVLCLTALAVWAATWAEAGSGLGRWAIAGAAAGAAALAHALVLVLVPAVLLHLALNRGVRDVMRAGAVFAAGALLAVAPATIHNAAASGEAILICSNGGHNLYIGNHSGNSTGLYTSPPFSRADMAYEEAGFRREAERREGRALRPGEISSYWAKQAMREMAEMPLLSLERFVRKLRWAINQEEIADTRTYGFYAHRLATTRLLLWDLGFPAVLGLIAAAVFVRERRLALPLAFAVLYTVTLAAFFVYGRYRLPLIVPLAILAGALLSRAGILARDLRPARVGALTATAVLSSLLVFGHVLPGVEESFFPDYFNQGNRYLAAGRMDEALLEYEKAITVKPGDHPAVAPAALRLAQMHLDRGDRSSAIRVLREAARIRPNERTLAAALGALGN